MASHVKFCFFFVSIFNFPVFFSSSAKIVTTKDSKPFNLINFGFYDFRQPVIRHTITKYPTMMDIHSNDSIINLVPLIVFANELAKALNSTLNSIFDEDGSMGIIPNHPTLLFDMYFTKKQNFKNFWMHYWNQTRNNLPIVTFSESSQLNFAYCDKIRTKYESPWQLAIFTSSFDLYCWTSLIISMIFVTALISFKQNINFISTLHLLLSVLLSFGICGLTKKTEKLVIFILWMMACLLLSNLYLGELSSMVISPPEPDIILSIQELHEKNFSLLYPDNIWRDSAKEAVTQTENPFDILETKITEGRRKNPHVTFEKFIDYFAHNKSKQAFVHLWPAALYVASNGRRVLERKMSNEKIKCHVGKYLLPVNSFSYAFLPPGNGKVFRVYQSFFDTGIYRRWIDEVIGLSHSRRIQDRSRVLGPTKMADDNVVIVSSLKLDGRVSKLFLLWGLCLSICSIVITLERMLFCKKLNIIICLWNFICFSG